ncbi:hypothetical protein H9Q72_001919 [Fusarium xylarioides]|uniref:Uncharacterized protein n=1 Tax=Fusarium xylarioides TaxID=221167 RepID=A0A9P7L9X2_9HYPO|nr:hypothetical protein H9Q70_000142 [Fusarium xylarioides]KAG5771613.1 hypothetical protein H9Q72_001919 [Fusarium xylarioides]KAG5786213.1 hypothetical protein H9Q73_000153 [Fusarium xylarioides]KAG5803146.1 hypothetical protein H9Q71_012266 [Fusarium xylarioides]KAG5815017.1 hypothetical protein H9Q74_011931 [Fusarium xylarioides]
MSAKVQTNKPVMESTTPPQSITNAEEDRKNTEELSREILYHVIHQLENQASKQPSIHSSSKPNSDDLEVFRFFVVTMIAISVFGASTFAVIVGEMTDPADLYATPTFSLKTVRLFLSVSWLSFAVSIALAGYSGSFLALMRQQAKGEIDEETIRKWTPLGLVVSAALHLLIVTGFLFMALSLVAYVGAFGWVIVGFSGLMYVVVFYLLVAQFRAL